MFSGLEIEMILFTKTGKPEPVFLFSSSHSSFENWKNDVTKLKLENWRSVTTKTETRSLSSFSNWKTGKLEKLEKLKQALRKDLAVEYSLVS